MRFRFCGDLDCPDWVLAEIGLMSRLTSVKMKLLCIQILNYLIGKDMDFEKIYKLTNDAKFDSSDVKACIAALSFILSSAAKYDIEDETLSNELQQLGLPKEHSVSLCKAYADKFALLQNHLKEESLRLSQIEQVKWRADCILASNHLKEVNEPMVTICINKKEKRSNNDKNCSEHAISMSSEKLRVILYELKEAARMMESLT